MTKKRQTRTSARVMTTVLASCVGIGALGAGSTMGSAPDAARDDETRVNPEESIDIGAIAAMARARMGGGDKEEPEFKPWSEVSKGFEKVVSTADGKSLYDLYLNEKTNQVLAELPRRFEKQRNFFAMTVASGEVFAGLQAADMYTQWKRVGKRLMLVEPQVSVRSTGDQESRTRSR